MDIIQTKIIQISNCLTVNHFFDIDLLKQSFASVSGVFIALLFSYLLDKYLNKRKVDKIFKLLSEEAKTNKQTLNDASKYINGALNLLAVSQINDFSPYYVCLDTYSKKINKDIFSIITQQNLFFYINNNVLKNIYAAYNRMNDIKSIVDSFRALSDMSQAERDNISRVVIERERRINIVSLLKACDYIIKQANDYNEKLIIL